MEEARQVKQKSLASPWEVVGAEQAWYLFRANLPQSPPLLSPLNQIANRVGKLTGIASLSSSLSRSASQMPEAIGALAKQMFFPAPKLVVFGTGDRVLYAGSDTEVVEVKVVGVRWEDGQPHYTIRLPGNMERTVTQEELWQEAKWQKRLNDLPNMSLYCQQDMAECVNGDNSDQASPESDKIEQPATRTHAQPYASSSQGQPVTRTNISAALEPDEIKIVNAYFDTGDKTEAQLGREVISELNNIPVTRLKIMCLQPTIWLNDEVINYYIELLKVLTCGMCNQHAYCVLTIVPPVTVS